MRQKKKKNNQTTITSLTDDVSCRRLVSVGHVSPVAGMRRRGRLYNGAGSQALSQSSNGVTGAADYAPLRRYEKAASLYQLTLERQDSPANRFYRLDQRVHDGSLEVPDAEALLAVLQWSLRDSNVNIAR